MTNPYRRLFVFVEGADDERFFEAVLVDKLSEQYDDVSVQTYATKKADRLQNFVKAINSTEGWDYIWTGDMDHAPSVEKRKQVLARKFDFLDPDKICIVVLMIESWYVSGLSSVQQAKLKCSLSSNCNRVDKQKFESIKPPFYKTRTEFMIEICSRFSVSHAIKNNRSFEYFCKKFCDGWSG